MERERERERAGWGGWEEEGQRGRRKMVKKNSRLTCWLQWCSHQMDDFQVWRLTRESWKFAVIHWPWHASLRYLAELNSQLRQTYDQTQVAFECCSWQLRRRRSFWNKSTTDPATKTSYTRGLTHDFPLLLKVDSSLRRPICISKEDFVRLTSDADRRPCSPKYSSPFLLSCGGHGVTTEWNIYTKTSFTRRKHGLPVNTSRAQTFHKFWFLRQCQCFSTCRSRGQAIGTRRSFHGKRTPF